MQRLNAFPLIDHSKVFSQHKNPQSTENTRFFLNELRSARPNYTSVLPPTHQAFSPINSPNLIHVYIKLKHKTQSPPKLTKNLSFFRNFKAFLNMNSRNLSTLLIFFMVSVALLSHVGVEATRVLQEDSASANHLVTRSSVYEKAKFSMGCWLQRLASGPSPRGKGH